MSTETGSAPGHERGLLDTCVVIDLAELAGSGTLPRESAVSALTLAELAQGVATAKSSTAVMARAQLLSDVEGRFDALPFDAQAARRYGTLVAMTVAAGHDPRPRRIDLMIAAVAAAHSLPLFTRNGADFKGLEGALTVVSV
ncbi:MAG: type II toxin-antitoxin system VapC family toxin [Micromonosporaceae bacterium]